MDVSEQINLFYKFIEADYYKDLIRQVSQGNKFLKGIKKALDELQTIDWFLACASLFDSYVCIGRFSKKKTKPARSRFRRTR